MQSDPLPRGFTYRRLQWLAGLLVVAAAVVAGVWLRPTADQLRSISEEGGAMAPVLFVAVGVGLISLLVPKTIISISAGALFGTLGGTVLMLFVATAAAGLNYGFARWLVGDSLVSWSSERPRWNALRRLARDGGFRLQLLLRLAPIPTMLISYACGAAGARFGPYLAAAAVAVASQVLWVHSGTIASQVAAGAGSGDPSGGGDPTGRGAATAEWVSLVITVAASVVLTLYLKRLAKRELAHH